MDQLLETTHENLLETTHENFKGKNKIKGGRWKSLPSEAAEIWDATLFFLSLDFSLNTPSFLVAGKIQNWREENAEREKRRWWRRNAIWVWERERENLLGFIKWTEWGRFILFWKPNLADEEKKTVIFVLFPNIPLVFSHCHSYT